MGDMIMVDVHIEVDAALSIVEGHDIATAVQRSLMGKHPVLNVMTHIDPVPVPALGDADASRLDRRLRPAA
ncbi:hypothetical protein PPGU19_015200 [Paraburkholderia sp. PGU19]|nr:hypothetical protein PPGU19_015200 [Paraburkholderia sp. PGU19]